MDYGEQAGDEESVLAGHGEGKKGPRDEGQRELGKKGMRELGLGYLRLEIFVTLNFS